MDSNLKQLPMIALRGRIFFPNRKVNFEVFRKKSVQAMEKALKTGGYIFFAAQKEIALEEISTTDIFNVGVIGKIEQILKLPGGNVKVFAECFDKYQIEKFNDETEFFSVDLIPISEYEYQKSDDGNEKDDIEYRALLKLFVETFDEYARIAKVGPEFAMEIISSEDLENISYIVGERVDFPFSDKQKILEETNVFERAKFVIKLMK